MTDLFDRIVLPVADPEDATVTCGALAEHEVGSVLAVHVIEKAGGVVRALSDVDDGYTYPTAEEALSLTLTPL